MSGGEVLTETLADVTPASLEQIRQGLLTSAGEVQESGRAAALLQLIDRLEDAPDAAALLAAARLIRPPSAADRQPRRVSP